MICKNCKKEIKKDDIEDRVSDLEKAMNYVTNQMLEIKKRLNNLER